MQSITWDEVVAAARAISWVAYLGTADSTGQPHVSAVAPGFSSGRVWVATRPRSRKFRNLRENRAVALHWPVSGEGPGELAAWGTATLHEDESSKQRIWGAGYMTYDLAGFFGDPTSPDLAFVEIAVERARLLGPTFESQVWRP